VGRGTSTPLNLTQTDAYVVRLDKQIFQALSKYFSGKDGQGRLSLSTDGAAPWAIFLGGGIIFTKGFAKL